MTIIYRNSLIFPRVSLWATGRDSKGISELPLILGLNDLLKKGQFLPSGNQSYNASRTLKGGRFDQKRPDYCLWRISLSAVSCIRGSVETPLLSLASGPSACCSSISTQSGITGPCSAGRKTPSEDRLSLATSGLSEKVHLTFSQEQRPRGEILINNQKLCH